MEEATAEAEKHGDRSSEPLAALVAEARVMIEQARAVQAERAKAATEEAEAAAAVKAATAAEAAAERQQMEVEMAALALTMQSGALRMQHMQAQLGVPTAAPAPHPDDAEDQCVLCMDAPKDHIIVPCGHQCVCEACAETLKKARNPLCPFCRAPIHQPHRGVRSLNTCVISALLNLAMHPVDTVHPPTRSRAESLMSPANF